MSFVRSFLKATKDTNKAVEEMAKHVKPMPSDSKLLDLARQVISTYKDYEEEPSKRDAFGVDDVRAFIVEHDL